MSYLFISKTIRLLFFFILVLEPLREIMREKLTLMRENDLKFQVDFAQLEEDSSEFLTNYRLYQKQSLLSPTKSKINIDQLPISINEQSAQLTTEQIAARQEKQIEYDKLTQKYKELLQITTAKIHSERMNRMNLWKDILKN